jgi:precorrin-2 dehydrogenase/sirohydrochlorin ferrochelatase
MKYYPVFLNLEGKKAVVIGGGKVAERKAIALIKSGALVKIISPTITQVLERYKKKGLIKHVRRNYKKGDLKGAFVVIIGTSSRETNIKIANDARQLTGDGSPLINIVDSPNEGNFIVPAVIRRGPLTIAISTEGCSPAVSKAIRKEIERSYGSEFARYIRFAGLMRQKAMEKITDTREREKFLKTLASPDIFNTLRSKGLSIVSEKILNYLNKV